MERYRRAAHDAVVEALAEDGEAVLVARGGSMLPTFAAGQRLRVVPAGPEGPAVGRVAVCRRNATLTVHRVVRRRSGEVVTRGDACRWSDVPWPTTAIIGMVEAVDTGSGWRPLPPLAPLRRLERFLRHRVLWALRSGRR